MTWFRHSTLVLLFTLLHVARIEGRIDHIDRQLKQNGDNKDADRLQKKKAGGIKDPVEVEVEAKTEARGKGKDKDQEERTSIVMGNQGEFALNDVCMNAILAEPGSIVLGNNDLGSFDGGVVKNCVGPDGPGLWYYVNGTGKVLRASLVETNHTQIVVFKGDDCNQLECEDAIQPMLSDMEGSDEETAGWTTFWGTEPGQNYYIYLYGVGPFQMMLTEQKRPENDLPTKPMELQIGTPLEGSTAFASPENFIISCDRYVQ